MSFHYTDEKIPQRPLQGGKGSRSVFDAGERASRWKIISQEELFHGPRGEERQETDSHFLTLIRMARGYQVTDEGRRKAFLEQAKWMESYEEDGRIPNTEFYHQYVGYQEMDVWELHGYFSWRTRFRRGESVPYCLEYMRLHAAELINLIGVSDMPEAFERLLKLQAADRKKLSGILAGFVIAWAAASERKQIGDPERQQDTNLQNPEQRSGILCQELLQEYCIPNMEREAENVTLLYYEESNDAAIYRMICSLTPNRIRSCAFLSQAGEDAWRVIARVFRSVCRRQKKAGSPVLAERLLGQRRVLQRELFPMMPYETRAGEGCLVEVSPTLSYTYKEGHWYRSDYPLLRDEGALRELHDLVRECERVLRKKLHYKNQLPDRMKNPVLAKMISEETDRWLKEKALKSRPEVRVDLTKLGRIRDLAAITRERLLEGTDEGADVDALGTMMNGAEVDSLDKMMNGPAILSAEVDEEGCIAGREDIAGTFAATNVNGAGSEIGEGVFDSQETAFLKLLLSGGNGADFFRDHRILPSVFVDAINDKAFDEIGDSIVEEDGAGWRLVEDYIGDIWDLL